MNDAPTRIVEAIAATLLHALWQGLLVGVLAALALLLLKKARPQVRYAVAFGALLGCMALAVITLIYQLSAPNAAVSDSIIALVGQPRTIFGQVFDPVFGRNTKDFGQSIAPWLVIFWACGSGLMFLRLIMDLASIKCLYLNPTAPLEWQTRVDRLTALMGLRPVVLLLSAGIGSPLSMGWLRPIVLLPAGLLSQMPVAHIEALLAHELAHIRRHDYLLNMVQVAVEGLLFFHPVVWWLSRQIRLEREQIADALAVATTGSARPLAQALAALADLPNVTSLALAQSGDGGVLATRIKRLLHPQASVQRPFSTALALLGLSMATLSVFACAQVVRTATESAVVKNFSKSDRLSFALVRRDAEAIFAWGPDDEIDSIARALPHREHDFVLLRRNGVDALVTDAKAVSILRRQWEQAAMLDAQNAALDLRLMQQHADAERLIEKIKLIETQPSNTRTMAQLKRQSLIVELELDRSTREVQRTGLALQLAYVRVEQQLRDVIANSPTLAL